MGTPRELLGMALEEVMRLLIGLADQRERIEIAVNALRMKPDSDLFARVADPNHVEKARAFNEVRYFFVVVRGMLGMATAMKLAATQGGFSNVHQMVCRAIDRFNDTAPHATAMRDFLIHMDAYIAGTGHIELPHPEHRVWMVTPGDDVGLYFGGVPLMINATRGAAEELGLALRDAVRSLEEEEKASPSSE
jgi:hypothetical protein